MENIPGPRMEALCSLCIVALYSSNPNYRLMRPPAGKDTHHYPSKIIQLVLDGTHTIEIVGPGGTGGQQITFKAVTVYQGTDLCASHVTEIASKPYFPREYYNR